MVGFFSNGDESQLIESVKKSPSLNKRPNYNLVGGFNPFETYHMLVKLDHVPNFRDEHKKCLSCHHLANISATSISLKIHHFPFQNSLAQAWGPLELVFR